MILGDKPGARWPQDLTPHPGACKLPPEETASLPQSPPAETSGHHSPALPTTNPAIPGPGHPDLTHSPQVGQPACPRGGTEGCPGLSPPGRVVLLWFRPGRHRRVVVSLLWGRPSLGGLLGISGLRPPDASSIAPPPHSCLHTTAPKALTPQILVSR